jgi:hypothetical protein
METINKKIKMIAHSFFWKSEERAAGFRATRTVGKKYGKGGNNHDKSVPGFESVSEIRSSKNGISWMCVFGATMVRAGHETLHVSAGCQ